MVFQIFLSRGKASSLACERENKIGRNTPYGVRTSPGNTHKLIGIYVEVLLLGVIL